jgi:two-component system, NarL family, nitrate/nitrite response regulator NarL
MKTLLLDDHAIFLDGLNQLLSNISRIQVVHKTADPFEALQVLIEKEIQLVVTDLSMPIMDGNTFIEKVKNTNSVVKILVLSMHMDSATVKKTIAQNIDGYIFKDSDFQQMSEAINSITSGKKYFDKRVSHLLLAEESNEVKNKLEVLEQLTDREIDVLKLLAKEHTQNEIAEKLFISASTVVYHKRKLMVQLNLKNANGLIRFAVENGLA